MLTYMLIEEAKSQQNFTRKSLDIFNVTSCAACKIPEVLPRIGARQLRTARAEYRRWSDRSILYNRIPLLSMCHTENAYPFAEVRSR